VPSGSFIRSSSHHISFGKPFIQALEEKYIDNDFPDDANTVEKLILGSSKGNIVVEAPRLFKVRGRLADLLNLREVSFDPGAVNGPGKPGEISARCPSMFVVYFCKYVLAFFF
jgi:tubulin-specific chaperone E